MKQKHIFSSEKAQLGELGKIILILAGAIVLFLFITKVTGDNEMERAINTCRTSVLLQSSTELRPSVSGWKSPLDIDCEKRYVQFYNTRVEAGLSPESTKLMEINYDGRKVKKFTELKEQTVNQVIAEEMRTCWFQFGEGDVDVFPNNDDILNDVCFVCSEIHFSDTVEKKEFYGFNDYLKNTILNNYGKSYYVYFSNIPKGENSWSEEIEYLKGKYPNVIDLSKFERDNEGYAIIFYKDYNWFSKNGYAVLPIKLKDLNTVCDEQAG